MNTYALEFDITIKRKEVERNLSCGNGGVSMIILIKLLIATLIIAIFHLVASGISKISKKDIYKVKVDLIMGAIAALYIINIIN